MGRPIPRPLRVAGIAVLVLVLLYEILPGPNPTTGLGEPYPTTQPCAAKRMLIQIYGTDSTGVFKPTDEVRALDPNRPGPIFFGPDQPLNSDFDDLRPRLSGDCVLTFSYDDIYLTEDGVVRPGVNAWNVSTSPWNRKPEILADYLQRLMDAYPRDVKFDIIAYSAGGIVPTYWAVRDRTTDEQRRRVNSISVADGIVSGVNVLADFVCDTVFNVRSFRNFQIASFGRFPCQFAFGRPFTTAVRESGSWGHVNLTTVRARGDRIVWYEWAGLPGKALHDFTIRAADCSFWDAVTSVGQCMLDSHGTVLKDLGAKGAISQAVALP
jgi:hypothetical protein